MVLANYDLIFEKTTIYNLENLKSFKLFYDISYKVLMWWVLLVNKKIMLAVGLDENH